MKVLKYWLEAMRLRTLPVSVAGVIMACGFSVADGTFKPAVAAICSFLPCYARLHLISQTNTTTSRPLATVGAAKAHGEA